MDMPKVKEINHAKIFLTRLADLCDQFNASLYYTTDDDGINITVNGELVFADLMDDTKHLRERIEKL